MPRSKRVAQDTARQHLGVSQLGRQLRAAFEPVPTAGGDDFADLLAKLDRVERDTIQRQAAE